MDSGLAYSHTLRYYEASSLKVVATSEKLDKTGCKAFDAHHKPLVEAFGQLHSPWPVLRIAYTAEMLERRPQPQ